MKHPVNVDHPVNLKHLMIDKECLISIVKLINKECPCRISSGRSLLEEYIYMLNISYNFAYSNNSCALESERHKCFPACCTCDICEKKYRYCKSLDSHQDELQEKWVCIRKKTSQQHYGLKIPFGFRRILRCNFLLAGSGSIDIKFKRCPLYYSLTFEKKHNNKAYLRQQHGKSKKFKANNTTNIFLHRLHSFPTHKGKPKNNLLNARFTRSHL